MPDRHIIVVEPTDNVATSISEVDAGETIEIDVGDETRTITVTDDVPFGHKIAIADIPAGETVYKYSKSIGNASEKISAGDWVHVHNVESNYGRGDLANEGADEEPAKTGE
jgi:altronate dehydratase small subunit